MLTTYGTCIELEMNHNSRSPPVVPVDRVGPLQSLSVVADSIGDRVRVTLACCNCQLKIPTVRIYINTSTFHIQTNMFHTTVILHVINAFKYVIGAIWQVMCRCAVNSQKQPNYMYFSIQETNIQHRSQIRSFFPHINLLYHAELLNLVLFTFPPK